MEPTNQVGDSATVGRLDRLLERIDQLLARFEKEAASAEAPSAHRPDSTDPHEGPARFDRGDMDRLRQDLRQDLRQGMQRGFERIEALLGGLGIDIEGDE